VISFQMTDEQEVVREAMHDFAAQVVRPLAREADESERVPEGLLEKVHELGLVATQLPESCGGGGEPRSPLTNAIVLEELAWGDVALALAALAPTAFAFAIADQGSPAQQRAYLPAFGGSAAQLAALALLEPGPLFDPALPRSVAEPKGERGFVLSGAKSLVPWAHRASHFLVVARHDGGRDAFIVPREGEGVSLGPPEHHLGLRALPTATVSFERVEVPAEARLGGPSGCDVQRLVDAARIALAAVQVGLSRAVLEYALPYARERRAFGQAIAQKQAIAFRLADMHVETEAQRWLVWQAASRLERGLPATRAAHHARVYAAQHAMSIADQGVQVLGGHGFIREHPVEMWYRHARTLSVLEGTLSV